MDPFGGAEREILDEKEHLDGPSVFGPRYKHTSAGVPL